MSSLIVFSGLPGVGKTTLARRLAAERRAVYLRIDTIEQAIRDSGELVGEVGGCGYLVGYALAEANLRLGHAVVADSVNPLAMTRQAWRDAGHAADAVVVEIEVVCADPAEHRRRVETRQIDVAGLTPPTWDEVVGRDYQPWSTPRLVIDTARLTIEAALAAISAEVETRLNAGAG